MREDTLSFGEKLTRFLFIIFWSCAKKISWEFARKMLYWGISDRVWMDTPYLNSHLNTTVFGKKLPNPIGIAAGFDTEIKYNDELVRSGFGFSEFGTFTYQRNRVEGEKITFVPAQKALLISSNNFQNNGISNLGARLVNRRRLPYMTGVSLSSSIEMDEKSPLQFIDTLEQDLGKAVQHVAPYCDYVVLNLSNPQTSIHNLLQDLLHLEETIQLCQNTIKKFAPILTPKLLVKIPVDPQLDVDALAHVFMDTKIDGVIVGGYSADQTMKQAFSRARRTDCISGAPLSKPSTELIRQFYHITKGNLVLIACGGVFTGKDAFEKIQAGANLIQLHTALLYEGPSIANKINKELTNLLEKAGFENVEKAVGTSPIPPQEMGHALPLRQATISEEDAAKWGVSSTPEEPPLTTPKKPLEQEKQ